MSEIGIMTNCLNGTLQPYLVTKPQIKHTSHHAFLRINIKWSNCYHYRQKKEAIEKSVREGAIIPFDPVRQYTSEKVAGNTTLKIYSGTNGSYTLYEDDGSTQDYLKGAFTQTLISWDETRRTLTLKPVHQNGRKTVSRKFTIEVLPEGLFRSIEYKGKELFIRL